MYFSEHELNSLYANLSRLLLFRWQEFRIFIFDYLYFLVPSFLASYMITLLVQITETFHQNLWK